MSTIISKSQRPVRTYTTGPITRALRWFAVLSTVGITAWLLVRYPSLPDTVATHFDARGEADDWGPKWSILVLAGVMLLLSLGFAALSTRPRAFNYPLEITTRNAQAIYREGERMMVWTLLAMVVVYLGIAWSVLETGGAPLIAAGLAVMVAAVVVGVIRLVRAGR
ncbi:MAG: DUF1648 domain-containing protein [Brachybacterium sp.]|uniref:DUF1648 domain-containing protein n=1 Tax=unclassified Brachybacterium TaxID=2623841 RepID=UPI003F8D98C8